MRQIILDTETTGLDWIQGHRIIEIGCIEMIDRKLTANHFHHYLNPERSIDAGAQKVHGISSDFLKNKPLFKDIFNPLIEFIEGAELIIHNASFDVGFLNHEFSLMGYKQSLDTHCTILDTLLLARKMHPGQKNNLDALCKRYNVNNTHRSLHGALLDANILANVYLAMTGGQTSLFEEDKPAIVNKKIQTQIPKTVHRLSVIPADATELTAHQQQIKLIEKKSNKKTLWPESVTEK